MEKRIKLNLHFKLSYQNSNFVLTLGYANPALNNPALRSNRLWFAISCFKVLLIEYKFGITYIYHLCPRILHPRLLKSQETIKEHLL